MVKEFLRALPLDLDTLERLSAAHADSLFELASVAQSAPEAFRRMLSSRAEADRVRSVLWSQLRAEERAALAAPAPDFQLGAIIDRASPPMEQ